MLRMCPREQLGNDLRRAVRDVVCDENFDVVPTRQRLDFEIVLKSSTGQVAQEVLSIMRRLLFRFNACYSLCVISNSYWR